MGDYALQQFAQVLKTVFPASATVGRMGGDEFIAIVPNADSAEIDRYVENMQQEMQLRSQKEDSITLSAAYGCAFSSERKDAHAVYSLADERMYECKRAMKMGRR